MGLVLEIERMLNEGNSMDSTFLAYCPGGKANTAVTTSRTSHVNPTKVTINGHEEGRDSEDNSDDAQEIRVFMNGTISDDAFGAQLKVKPEQPCFF
jgi:hypothetical protein